MKPPATKATTTNDNSPTPADLLSSSSKKIGKEKASKVSLWSTGRYSALPPHSIFYFIIYAYIALGATTDDEEDDD